MDYAVNSTSGLKRALIIGKLALAVIFITACGTPDPGLRVGDRAPEFSLVASDGDTVSLTDYLGEQPVLLYFHMALG